MIDNNKKYTISEASEIIGYSNHVLRFYEKEFQIEVPRNKSNHRYYTYIEIEKFLYIKSLKEKGLSNSQIKEILKSPEIVIDNGEIAATCSESELVKKELNPVIEKENLFPKEIYEVKRIIGEKIDYNFKLLKEDLIEEMRGVFEEIKNQNISVVKNEDKDTLISENARLRMKLKEKAYETAILREKLKKLENKKLSFFSKIFGTNK